MSAISRKPNPVPAIVRPSRAAFTDGLLRVDHAPLGECSARFGPPLRPVFVPPSKRRSRRVVDNVNYLDIQAVDLRGRILDDYILYRLIKETDDRNRWRKAEPHRQREHRVSQVNEC